MPVPCQAQKPAPKGAGFFILLFLSSYRTIFVHTCPVPSVVRGLPCTLCGTGWTKMERGICKEKIKNLFSRKLKRDFLLKEKNWKKQGLFAVWFFWIDNFLRNLWAIRTILRKLLISIFLSSQSSTSPTYFLPLQRRERIFLFSPCKFPAPFLSTLYHKGYRASPEPQRVQGRYKQKWCDRRIKIKG